MEVENNNDNNYKNDIQSNEVEKNEDRVNNEENKLIHNTYTLFCNCENCKRKFDNVTNEICFRIFFGIGALDQLFYYL